jgi:hypothetical protein
MRDIIKQVLRENSNDVLLQKVSSYLKGRILTLEEDVEGIIPHGSKATIKQIGQIEQSDNGAIILRDVLVDAYIGPERKQFKGDDRFRLLLMYTLDEMFAHYFSFNNNPVYILKPFQFRFHPSFEPNIIKEKSPVAVRGFS